MRFRNLCNRGSRGSVHEFCFRIRLQDPNIMPTSRWGLSAGLMSRNGAKLQRAPEVGAR